MTFEKSIKTFRIVFVNINLLHGFFASLSVEIEYFVEPQENKKRKLFNSWFPGQIG